MCLPRPHTEGEGGDHVEIFPENPAGTVLITDA
jgi:hypothetical protein